MRRTRQADTHPCNLMMFSCKDPVASLLPSISKPQSITTIRVMRLQEQLLDTWVSCLLGQAVTEECQAMVV